MFITSADQVNSSRRILPDPKHIALSNAEENQNTASRIEPVVEGVHADDSPGRDSMEKMCSSPCYTSSPSSSPSLIKSSQVEGMASTVAASDGDDSEVMSCSQNGTEDDVGIRTSLTPNGVLTPPIDVSDSMELKPIRYNGKLEFFKEGVLCLELSHCEEAQGRKWLKTKERNDVRQAVRVSKEVSIPYSPGPSNLMHTNPPNGFSALSYMSDDGSSPPSSSESTPSREKGWRKQPLPQKLISSYLQFFMKPSPCIHNFETLHPSKSDQKYLNPRRPYASSQLFSVEGRENCPQSYLCNCGLPNRRRSITTLRRSRHVPSIDSILPKLQTEKGFLHGKGRPPNSFRSRNPRHEKARRQHTSVSTPSKKRPSKDLEVESKPSVGKSISKRSPTKNFEKTILSVPGIANPFTGSKSPSSLPHKPGNYGDATDGRLVELSIDAGLMKIHQRKSPKPNTTNSRSSPSISLLKSPQADLSENEALNIDNNGNLSEDSSQEEIILSPEEQEQFQQHAMSKAISYTINSLLGAASPPTIIGNRHQASSVQFCNPCTTGTSNTIPQVIVGNSNFFGNEHDKNLLLRHLLDTSDPIPTHTHAPVTSISPTLASKAQSESPERNHKNILKMSQKGSRSSKSSHPYLNHTEPKLSRGRTNIGDSRSGKASINHVLGADSSQQQSGNSAHQSPAYMHPSQLESLTAATIQYASRLHPHLIPQVPAQLGKHPSGFSSTNNFPLPTQSHHPINSHPSHERTSSGTRGEEEDVPINLSQKDGDWPGAKSLQPDRASRNHSRDRAFPDVPHENFHDESDPDLPLDLCKKRRND